MLSFSAGDAVRRGCAVGVWLIVTSVACAASPDASADPAALPITVAVAVDHTYLRCGPGDDFYPTERLVAGAAVEVWTIDESGYCAVRPVKGSFSWVLAGRSP